LTLLAVPNVSEGRDGAVLDAIGAAFTAAGARVLDRHQDPDHHRAVFTLAGAPGALAAAVRNGVAEAVARIDISRHEGVHPRVGAVDVAPIVYLDAADRGAAAAEALVLADALGHELELPVFLYGDLAGGRTRAELRRGGPAGLAQRIASGELAPDYGPPRLHPTAGAVLVAARPPLVAFNVELAPPATLADARAIAARIREGGAEGLPGVRAIGLALERGGIVQVSTNVEDHTAASPADVVAAVRRHAPVAGAELVALAPRAALEGFPADVPLRGRALIEDRLRTPPGNGPG
jgi:glutamate formiminotransferase